MDALLRPVLALLLASEVLASDRSGSRRDFEEACNRAMTAERAGRWDDAALAWEKANAIAPAAFRPQESLARLSAKVGNSDAAFVWLRRAYDGCYTDPILGFFNPAWFSEGEDYAPLRADPRWTTWLEELKVQCDAGDRRWNGRQTDLDWQSAPAFRSYRKVAAAFDSRRKNYEKERWRMSFAEQHAGTTSIREQRIAALHRYLQEHPSARDRADAAWDVIDTRIWPRYVERRDRWGSFGTQVLEELDSFLREYPNSSHCGQAAFDRAFVAFAVRPEGGTGDRSWRDEDIIALEQGLADVSTAYSGTTAGGLALAWRLLLADDPSSRADVPALRAMLAELDTRYRHDKKVQETLWPYRATALILISGIADFDGTDLSGTRWTAASFKGKVTLIDFWATWCGPCVGDIPTIRKAWDDYHDKGLAVLGVSLDFDDRAQFEGWLTRNDVAWPQIWDGKGFSTPLADKYGVHGIPFTVLVDRDGRVTNVNLRGDALLARIKALLE